MENPADDRNLHAVSHTALSPLSFLSRSAAVFRDCVAVVDEGEELTWAAFADHAGRVAGGLRALGIGAGDRVAVLCPNTRACLTAHFAVPLTRGVLVANNIRLAPAEIGYILQHCGARVLIVDAELALPLANVLADLPKLEVIVVDEARGGPALDSATLAALEASGCRLLLHRELETIGPPLDQSLPLDDEDRPLSINYTSGTTGRPKGVLYTHRSAYLNALGQVISFKLDVRTVYLWTLPLFHCNGWTFPWAVAAVGGRHLLLRRVDPAEILHRIETFGVTHFCAAPTVLIMLANHPGFDAIRLRSGLTIATGGAPPAPAVIAAVEAIGADLQHIYGLTETYGPHTLCEWQPAWDGADAAARAQHKSRQGMASVTAAELRVVDEQMNDVPADATTQGEVVMHGNNVMAGYFRDVEATREAFRGGWFHSGDVAVVHADGYIEIRDRRKDIIISGGENISTVEVERTLSAHAAVMEVAVIGIPDEKWGEVPKAFVVLKRGAVATGEELIGFCRERLARFKCPKTVEFGDLPKTATGKVQKFVLREREWAGQAKRVN